MRIVEIAALDNGAHRNQECHGFSIELPAGWAVIPDDMVCENFPFGEVTVADIDGVATVTKWTPGTMPAPEPEPEPEEPADGDLAERVAAVETDLADLTAAVEKGLNL
jgi:hypothetical protein